MCLAAGVVLIILPRLPPVKALVNSLTSDFQDPEYASLLPVMTCVGCLSDALLLAALFYMLPFLLVASTVGASLPPQSSGATPGEQLPLDACGGCHPGAWASVDRLPVAYGSDLKTQPYRCNMVTAWQLPAVLGWHCCA